MLTNFLIECILSVVVVFLPIAGMSALFCFSQYKDRERKLEALHSKFGEGVKLISCLKLESPFKEVGPGLLPELLLERFLKIWTPRQMKELGSVILLWESADGNIHLSWYKEGRLFEERDLFHRPPSFARNPKIGIITHDLLLTLDLKLIPDQPSSD